MMPSSPIYPCLWFDHQAKEAADFYAKAFKQFTMLSENPMVVYWELFGLKMMGLNGGNMFRSNPSHNFFVLCDTREELDDIWSVLGFEAMVMMPLGKYAWSEYYVFLQDRFGISWQLMLKAEEAKITQKVVPCFLFTDANLGRAAEAIQFYTSVFKNASIDHISFYPDMGQKELVMHAQFTLDNLVINAMDGTGEHHFQFNEAVSFVIPCDTQEQIDYYWNKLVGEGGEEGNCGWCKDKFGVSWQVVPSMLGQLMKEKGQRVVAAFMKMKKFDIQTLVEA